MTDFISVIIPTYNPAPSRLRQTIAGLKAQNLPPEDWELILVDNNSTVAVAADLSWHPQSRIIREEKQGLSHARLKGFDQARGNIIIMVDDDNILGRDYLRNTLAIFRENSSLGAIGGKTLPQFEVQPPRWVAEFYGNLALRDLGTAPLVSSWDHTYPVSAPIGAGMGIRKAALAAYLAKIQAGTSAIADRTGNTLSSGGDNDLVLEILKSGWQVGYFPSLSLVHIIPQQRIQAAYLARLLNETNRSWVEVLAKHRINPWESIHPWTVPIRKIKAWFRYRAWQHPSAYIKWRGACGLFDGLAIIKKNAQT
ncbi:glycosyltransferase [Mucilaginibacter sp. AW1-7]|uniref:glycosyltransferase n=1 Tax=Mucilaginibacter sp. AW1-7 TaxID=3349874 RepID=UPI003F736CD5